MNQLPNLINRLYSVIIGIAEGELSHNTAHQDEQGGMIKNMFRIITAIVIAVMMLTAAVAPDSGEVKYTKGWTAEVTDVKIHKGEKDYALKTGLQVRIITTEDHRAAQMTVSLVQNGQDVLSIWMEAFEDGSGGFALNNSETYGTWDGGTLPFHLMIMTAYGMNLTDANTYISLSAAMDELEGFMAQEDALSELIDHLAVIEKDGDKTLLTLNATDEITEAVLTLHKLVPEAPLFSFEGKRPVKFSPMKGLWAAEGMEDALFSAYMLMLTKDPDLAEYALYDRLQN